MASNGMCILCGQRPHSRQSHVCQLCTRTMAAREREKAERLNRWKTAFRYVHWRDVIAAYYDTGHDTVKAERLFKPLSAVPKCRLINLDEYCVGFTHDQVSSMKRTILKLAPELTMQIRTNGHRQKAMARR